MMMMMMMMMMMITPDGKIKGQISDIRMILSRLGNTVAKNDGKKIKGKLYKIEKKKKPFK